MRLHGNPVNGSTYVPSGRLWPSGDFSLGSKKVEGDSRVDYRTFAEQCDQDGFTLPKDWKVGRWGFPDPSPVEEMVQAYPGCVAAALAASPLDLTDAPNSHKPPNRPESYGRQGITGYGRKMVRSACTILERVYKGRLTFATVTMPELPPELRRALAERWPELVRQLLQWLSRCLERQGLPKAVVSVSEIQPERIQAGNGGYLHLHLTWPNRRIGKGNWAIDVLAMRAWCEAFLLREGIWVEGAWVNVDTCLVTKSAAAYLSKYMSKGGDVLEEFVEENGWAACPGQWWNMTKRLRDKVKSEVLEGTDIGGLLQSVVEYAFECNEFDMFWFLHHVDMEHDGRLLTVGWFGALKEETRCHLVEMVRQAVA